MVEEIQFFFLVNAQVSPKQQVQDPEDPPELRHPGEGLSLNVTFVGGGAKDLAQGGALNSRRCWPQQPGAYKKEFSRSDACKIHTVRERQKPGR